MDERTKLLMNAAKAAGMTVWAGRWPQDDMLFAAPKKPDPTGKVTGVEWDPLTDDGDALRLSITLGQEVYHTINDNEWTVFVGYPTGGRIVYVFEAYGPDQFAATRRAIVRAAAAIGEQKCRT